MPIIMQIGKAIKILRKSKKLSQTELCLKAGITQASLSRIESGQNTPHDSTCLSLCKSLDIPIEFLKILSIDESLLSVVSRLKLKKIEEIIIL